MQSEETSIYHTYNKFYVFVVCGGKEHIETLHFALRTFEKNTTFPKIIITDSQRNEIPIKHNHIIDIQTPKHFDHHQASIFLKTSLHKYLPKGNKYVYMDTDILAIGKHCDDIFDQYSAPITFAPDHCKILSFSPAAVNCGCQESFDQLMKKLDDYTAQFDYYKVTKDEHILQQRKNLEQKLSLILKDKKKFIKTGIRAFFSWPIFRLDKDFKFNRKNKIWYNSDNQPVMTQVNWAKVAKKFDLKYDFFRQNVKYKNGKSIWSNECSHLQEFIKSKFHIDVKLSNWQHWNGGVFLFDDNSHDFLEIWHEYTLEIFKDPQWKTRDQGTLIATVWKLGLDKHPTLNEKWNYICDYNNKLFGYDKDNGMLTKDHKKYTEVEFAHVYHHFGDTSWDFWNWVTKSFR